MKDKTKRIIVVTSIILLLSLSLILVILNIIVGKDILENNSKDYSQERIIEEELELSVWRYQTEMSYLDKYCEIEELLPPNTINTPIINIEVKYYDTPMEVPTIYNPYPNYSTVYEMGIVTSSEHEDIDTSNLKLRLYRIELVKDATVNIEYVSHKDNPLFYIVQKPDNSYFLLYPQILKFKDILDNDYFVEIP